MGYNLLHSVDYLRSYEGLFTASLAIFYAILAISFYFKVDKSSEIKGWENMSLRTPISFAGLSLAFLTLIFPIQFGGEVTTLAWITQGFLLVLIGFKIRQPKLKTLGIIFYAVSVYKFFSVDFIKLRTSEAFFTVRSLMFLYVVVQTGMIAYLYFKNLKLEDSNKKNTNIAIFFSILSLVLFWGYITYEVYQSFNGVEESMYTTLVWAIYATILIVLGLLKKIKYLRIFSLIVFLVAIVKLFFVDIWMLEKIFRITAFICLGILLLFTSFLYNRFKLLITGE